MATHFIKLLHKLGDEGPKTALAIIALNCLALSTIRPLITLLNPNEEASRKRYAAIRESLTDFVAIPVVVGMGAVFKDFASPFLFKKESLEIDKDVLRKISTVSGITVGNLVIPFVATAVIGALFKIFPALNAKKASSAPKASQMGYAAQNAFSAFERELTSPSSIPRKLASPVSYQAYNAFRPIYRAPSL